MAIVEYFPSDTLPAAGAFADGSAYATEFVNEAGYIGPIRGIARVSWIVGYARGAAGGAPKLRVALKYSGVSPELVDVYPLIADETLDISSPPIGQYNLYVREMIGPAPADGNELLFTYTWENDDSNVSGVKLFFAEGGVTGTPGTLRAFVQT